MSDCRGRTEDSQHETRFPGGEETPENLHSTQHNIQEEKGRLLTGLHDILDRWKTYTGKLYVDESKDDDDTSAEEKAALILVDEVREAIRRLPCGKTAANRNSVWMKE